MIARLCAAALSISGWAVAADVQVHIKSAKELAGAIERVDRLFAGEYAKESLAGVTVGIISGPGLVWTKSYGVADIENKIPAANDTVYRIGSITKQFTAVMLLHLVAQGRLRLSDPVEKYFPEFSRIPRSSWTAPVTLLQLATHMSGLDREPDDAPAFAVGPLASWEKTLIAALPKMKFVNEPGTQFLYSNFGYAILGAALARAAGEPYVQYVTERILKPLGMDHSSFEPDEAMRSKLAKGYAARNGSVDAGPPAKELREGRGYKIPNGGIFTTAGDLARFVSFEMGDGPSAVLNPSILRDSFARAYSADGELSAGYGIGFRLKRIGPAVVLGHDGAVAGSLASAWFIRDSHLGLVFLRNADDKRFGPDLATKGMQALAER